MPAISIGLRHERKLLVTSEVAIDFLGVETARVLATPHLVWQQEMTCREAIKPMLEEGYDSVGTEVNIKHMAAAPMGMTVTIRAEVIWVDGNRVKFKVESWDETEKISEGTHERYVINIARFAAKVQTKAQSWVSHF